MHRKILPKLRNTTQPPQNEAMGNILEAANILLNEGTPNLTARKLSQKSGYSIGALYHYFHKAEHAFILVLFRRREKRLYKQIEIIDQFATDKPLSDLIELLVDSGLAEFNRINKNKKMIFALAKIAIKLSENLIMFDNALSILADPLISARKRNTTGTFREIERDELIMLLKLGVIALRRPFLEQTPIAGTQKHRNFVIDTMVRLLGN